MPSVKVTPSPFINFASPMYPQSALRRAITAACRRPETECLPPLIAASTQSPEAQTAIAGLAARLVGVLRARPVQGGVQGLVQEYALNSQEGVALMCLAEALLRIPDAATRDALIRDKISSGDWAAHLGAGRPLFVNAATWGLIVTGKLTATVNEQGLSAVLTRLVARLGEPVIRSGVDMAMRMMGEQFVTGQTIAEALRNSKAREEKGYRFSFDMLGEAATTAADAARYYRAYEAAIHAIGKADHARGPYGGNGISIKLSALHPRYQRSQGARVAGELLPRLQALAALAKQYDIGLNIDAEESDRLELSLDLLESLSGDPALRHWNGLGFVVQAYGRRCSCVIDFIIDLAKRTDRRIMLRLVKGAYWDSEIKRAQIDGLSDYPVFTRKVYTDVSYLACARKLLDARHHVFPQFATHNAQTLASIMHMAGDEFAKGDYEFQCLHGMGEPLYDQVLAGYQRPCRIYAPVGTHKTLLAYLVRRLLENGANSSFVHRLADASVPVDELITDPVQLAAKLTPIGVPHERIAAPSAIYGMRQNSVGLDLSNEATLKDLQSVLSASALHLIHAAPLLTFAAKKLPAHDILNPGNHRDKVGSVCDVVARDIAKACAQAQFAFPGWNATPVAARAKMLERSADLLQARMPQLMGLIMREAGKTAANAMSELREAIDFLRYYATEARSGIANEAQALGVIACISPWNFPLAIFLGQISAALVAGNTVLAKPAEETPLIAYEAVRLMHEAGIPQSVLQFLPGDGATGAAIVSAAEIAGVMFTGSIEVARLINVTLANRLSARGTPIPLIAETGGQNAMIVDSSALAEQVVGDVLVSAFDSAGQRCSGLRVLCLQEDVAEDIISMLQGAMAELRLGNTAQLCTDIGPIISASAKAGIDAHVEYMREQGHRIFTSNPEQQRPEQRDGTFVAPTLIEINSIAELHREVFGPVLHVLRYRRDELDDVIGAINATGYGLTFGLHTRLDDVIEQVRAKVKAGNLYVNRNTIGAVVGVQPFGGRGLSGTGPKAGGPLYLQRLLATPTPAASMAQCALQGPVGERNLYALHSCGRILCLAKSWEGLQRQIAILSDTGNIAVVGAAPELRAKWNTSPSSVQIEWSENWHSTGFYGGALVEGAGAELQQALAAIAALPGPVILTQSEPYVKAWLLEEVSTSINTTAAGGNVGLMTIGSC